MGTIKRRNGGKQVQPFQSQPQRWWAGRFIIARFFANMGEGMIQNLAVAVAVGIMMAIKMQRDAAGQEMMKGVSSGHNDVTKREPQIAKQKEIDYKQSEARYVHDLRMVNQ